jgi:hypothetical protein
MILYYCLLAFLAVLLLGALLLLDMMRVAVKAYKSQYRRHQANSAVQDNWLFAKNHGKTTAGYFVRMGYKKIAIYGANALCYRLLEELAKADSVVTAYIIDLRGKDVLADLPVCTPDELDKQEKVDVIVVAVVSICDEIKSMLEKKVNCPIVSIQEVINGL